MSTTTREEIEVLSLEPVAARPLAVHQGGALAVNSPAAMMLQAMSQGASLEQVEKMMALQERWEAGEARKLYNQAFALFKAEAVRVIKNKDVKAGPLSGNSYAELHSVVDAVTPALSKHGLSASWKLTRDEPAWLEITCTLSHASGHAESVAMGGPPDAGGAKNALQARASTITYLERYTLKAICGVAEGGQDDDGAGGSSGAKNATPAADESLVNDGEAAAMNGMKALTTWWAGLTTRQRSDMQKGYPALRKAAEAADKEPRHA